MISQQNHDMVPILGTIYFPLTGLLFRYFDITNLIWWKDCYTTAEFIALAMPLKFIPQRLCSNQNESNTKRAILVVSMWRAKHIVLKTVCVGHFVWLLNFNAFAWEGSNASIWPHPRQIWFCIFIVKCLVFMFMLFSWSRPEAI